MRSMRKHECLKHFYTENEVLWLILNIFNNNKIFNKNAYYYYDVLNKPMFSTHTALAHITRHYVLNIKHEQTKRRNKYIPHDTLFPDKYTFRLKPDGVINTIHSNKFLKHFIFTNVALSASLSVSGMSRNESDIDTCIGYIVTYQCWNQLASNIAIGYGRIVTRYELRVTCQASQHSWFR